MEVSIIKPKMVYSTLNNTKVNRNAIDPEITEADKASRHFTPLPTSLNLQEKNPNYQFSVGKVNDWLHSLRCTST